MTLAPRLSIPERKKELKHISDTLLEVVSDKNQDLIEIIQGEETSKQLRDFISMDGEIFRDSCKRRELPPGKVLALSKQIIGAGLHDIYIVSLLVQQGLIKEKEGVRILLENMKHGRGGFIVDTYEKYIKENGEISDSDSEIITQIQNLSQNRLRSRREKLPPRCPLFDAPEIEIFIRKMLQHFVERVLPELDTERS